MIDDTTDGRPRDEQQEELAVATEIIIEEYHQAPCTGRMFPGGPGHITVARTGDGRVSAVAGDWEAKSRLRREALARQRLALMLEEADMTHPIEDPSEVYETSNICNDQHGPLGLGWERMPGMAVTWRRDRRWAQGHGFICADTDELLHPTAPCLTPEDAVAEWLSDQDLVYAWRESQDLPVAEDALPDVLYVDRVVPATYLDDAELLATGILESFDDDHSGDFAGDPIPDIPLVGPRFDTFVEAIRAALQNYLVPTGLLHSWQHAEGHSVQEWRRQSDGTWRRQ